ncbi:hypothetical protein NL676_038390 [Syzygium grande]|nr:hypothetical protein NL676_038390 [Syzygium grande]
MGLERGPPRPSQDSHNSTAHIKPCRSHSSQVGSAGSGFAFEIFNGLRQFPPRLRAVKCHGFHSPSPSPSPTAVVSGTLTSSAASPPIPPLTTPSLTTTTTPPPPPPPSSDDKVVHIPWLEELRKLRVAELQQEVQRYDVSILSLQLKVKKLKRREGRELEGEASETKSGRGFQRR